MNTRKNNASKKVKWNGKTFISLKVFCEKVSKEFNENITPWLARKIIRSETTYHGHKIIVVKKRAKKPKAKKKEQFTNEALVWNNTSFDNYKEMADILEVKKAVIKSCLRNDEPLQGDYIDFKIQGQ
ncbi:unnamed protein product [marine sediment metagenome]|uniref:Uncharacterized protein n=1 Tax=marine sediment metagenome TaxID=412755 RepID=X0V0M6_9ZZZZ